MNRRTLFLRASQAAAALGLAALGVVPSMADDVTLGGHAVTWTDGWTDGSGGYVFTLRYTWE